MKRITAMFLFIFICANLFGCTQEASSVSDTAPAQTEAALSPTPAQAGEWFEGDWAGVYVDNYYWNAEPLTDFAASLSTDGPEQRVCLIRISPSNDGYIAVLGSSRWTLTEYDETGFIMRCTSSGGLPVDEYRFSAGDIFCFSYEVKLPSSVETARVPTTQILRGEAEENTSSANVSFLLARLPAIEERSPESGLYPYWYGGYDHMEGSFEGIFCLGTNKYEETLFAAVVSRSASGRGDLIVFASAIGGMDERMRVLLPRESGFDGIVQGQMLYDVPSLFWPTFRSIAESNHHIGFYADVTDERRDYFSKTYPAMLGEIEAQLLSEPQDIWVQRKLLAIKGLRHYAALAASGALASELLPHIQELVSLESEYLPEVSLAGLKPNDTLADAQALCTLFEIDRAEAESLGFAWGGRRTASYYTDGKGLIIGVLKDGRIDTVYVYAAGYQTPDGRQVGDTGSPEKDFLYGKDARISFSISGSLAKPSPIERIVMQCVLDRVWSETEADIDGDGEKERLTLSGRSADEFPEHNTALFGRDTELALPNDFGTKTTLRVYKNGILTEETTLPLSIGMLPCFFREDPPAGQVRIWCDTGGNSPNQPAYLVEKAADGWRTTFLGYLDH